jgi:hypothetical protein
LSENVKRSDYMAYLGVDGRIILKYFFQRCDVIAWTKFNWFRITDNNGEHGNETLESRGP